ncbi:MAG: Mut7-C RNAse domain-containing protein [Desulfobacterales bacterium]|nr:Mut7-C RNAse domain-containing protein [Desulfobacterales bacterium]MDD4071170.1 Mut7-C RNAse domain-containing protein [Desulfobacterales bacterium]MDD4393364.1 Mut7-C RNAse domain-containing protein [Desulfobacterales bacterium]
MDNGGNLCFAVKKSLGKLSKWLRILGFDTVYEQDVLPEQFALLMKQGRICLTRSARVQRIDPSQTIIFIRADKPLEQLRQVVRALDLTSEDIKPFARCSRCNVPVESVDKQFVFGRVPDYIWETQHRFGICSCCQRIYWPGSHTIRSKEIFRELFGL